MYNRLLFRVLSVALFIFLGLFAGVMLVPAMEGNGRQYVTGAVVLFVIAVFIILAGEYVRKGRRRQKTAGTEGKGSEVGFVVDTFHDVVARLKEKESELEKLKASAEEKAVSIEAYNAHILQSVPSGVISVDNDIRIKSINQAAETILGIDEGAAAGKMFDEIFREPLSTVMQEEKPVTRMEYPYVTDSGRHIWLGITTSQLRNSAGEKIGLIFVFTDLTDIKALQSRVELKERLSQLGEMSAGISHELRNSMSVISGYAKLLGKKVEASNQDTVDAIQTEIRSMDVIISELLAFAKPSVLHVEKVFINDLLHDTAESAAGDNRMVTVSIHTPGPVHVQGDTVLLRQAFTNLFINAMEAMPEGGSIEVGVLSSHGKAEITIRDTGHGMPPDIRRKIFLPFFTTKEKGIGFGLALVQKIIISHGGSIEVESDEGRGTSFMITLPSAE